MKKSCLQNAIQKQKGLCFYCHQPLRNKATTEHLLSKSRGGRKTYRNIKAAHFACNLLVGDLEVRHKLRLASVGKRFGFEEMRKVASHIRAEEVRLGAKRASANLARERVSRACSLTEGLQITLSRTFLGDGARG